MGIVTRFFQSTTSSFFLFGPLGSGKSTIIKHLYPTAQLIDLSNLIVLQQYSAYPERLEEFVKAQPDHTIFIINEVQKLPVLLSLVHHLIELKKGWQFILTGSSIRKLKREGVDLLAGRALLKHLHPFLASEIPQLFNLEKNLKLGMLPLVLISENSQAILETYIALYVKEEVIMEGIVRKLDQFSRFLEVVSFSQGAQINYSNIARECFINSKTVEGYVTLLEDLLLSFSLYPFTKKAQRLLSHHPKFYFFDAGVFQSIRPKGPMDKSEEIAGCALETLVGQHLRAWINYSDKKGQLYFWRTKNGLEVDFIIYGEIGFYAIEVKNTRNVNSQDLKGLQEFKNDYPSANVLLLHRGNDKIIKNEILCIPVNEFLLNLFPNQDIRL